MQFMKTIFLLYENKQNSICKVVQESPQTVIIVTASVKEN
jgi:hypothetical protein